MSDNNKNTEVATQESTDIATQPDPQATINLPALTQKEEALEVMQENLEGMEGQFKFDKVKIPSGGGISFEVVDEAGEPTPVKELKGVVVDYYPINAWWHDEFSGEKNAPTCSSMDCKTGTGSEEHGIPAGQACAKCPKNQWGSDPKSGRGKACKNMYRVYILQEDSVFPVLLALPPTSIGNWKQYVQRLTNKLKHYYSVVTVAKLEKDRNEGGIEYSKVSFAKAADLTPAEKKAIKDYARTMKPAMRSVAIDSTEYNTESAPAEGAYQSPDNEEEGY
ncbi:MAG: hypothetical protein FH749_06965 [Firmicutes bacterium]|nr:hypothetical protein [Bacillota bacterium]